MFFEYYYIINLWCQVIFNYCFKLAMISWQTGIIFHNSLTNNINFIKDSQMYVSAFRESLLTIRTLVLTSINILLYSIMKVPLNLTILVKLHSKSPPYDISTRWVSIQNSQSREQYFKPLGQILTIVENHIGNEYL